MMPASTFETPVTPGRPRARSSAASTAARSARFPYYLTEVNLLLQVSRLLGRLREWGSEPRTSRSAWSIRTAATRAGSAHSFTELGPGVRADAAVLAADERYGIVELDAAKQPRFDRIREDGSFDLVIGNPPYVFETGNKMLFDRLRAMPGWKRELPRQERLPLLLPRPGR